MSILGKVRRKYFSELERDLRFRVFSKLAPRTVEVSGIRVNPNSPLISPKIRRVLYRANYEEAEAGIIRRHLRPSDRVLELGSGLGVISALCAAAVGNEQVTTVEANPALEPLIRETHQLNRVAPKLVNSMVGTCAEEATFYVEPNAHSSSSRQRSEASTPITVRSEPLQHLIDRYKPTFLIIDVEGAESEILRDVDLAGVEKICIELHPHLIGDDRCNEVIDILRGAGFVMKIDEIRERTLFFERRAPSH